MKKFSSKLGLFLGIFCYFLGNLAQAQNPKGYQPGAYRMDQYVPKLQGKRLALVVNHTSLVEGKHLVDTLRSRGMNIVKIFAPEHGFRGKADAGAHIDNEVDAKTGIGIVSLYGKHYKPSAQDLAGVDQVLFDIQDVGARFYTYSSTLHYVMEACAEQGLPFMVLDRGNPNGWYVDGPVLDKKFASFVGLNPIPVVHGLTMGELALMINGESWLGNGKKCALEVIKAKKYQHKNRISIEVAPSPNLPNDQAIGLYPSLCLFEPTAVSVGRGTDWPFQVIGTPEAQWGNFRFTPVPKPGAMDPVMKNQECFGYDLKQVDTRKLAFSLTYLLEFFKATGSKASFFKSPSFFDKLAGTDQLRLQMLEGRSEEAIRASWEPGLQAYKKMRKGYLLYP